MTMADAFTRAYKDGQWHHGSGSGSSPANTRAYRDFLAAWMAAHRTWRVLDAGCGDWQFSRLICWDGIDYTGLDVVPGIAVRNQLRYGRYGVTFRTGDILDPGLWIHSGTDLIIVKDLLQHWPDDAILRLRARLLLQRSRALITYDHDGGTPRPDIEPGGYRPLDLTRRDGWPVTEVLRYESVSHGGTVTRVKTVMEFAP